MTNPVGSQQTVHSHQPQHPSLRGPNPLASNSCPHFAVSFPMKGRSFQEGLDLLHQLFVATRTQRARTSPGNLSFCTLPLPVDGRASNSPDFADSTQTVTPAGVGRNAAAYRLGLRRPKGRPSFMRTIFSLSSSLSMVIWAILASRRLIGSWRSSLGRPFNAQSPPFSEPSSGTLGYTSGSSSVFGKFLTLRKSNLLERLLKGSEKYRSMVKSFSGFPSHLVSFGGMGWRQ